jgi:hypothetical protein
MTFIEIVGWLFVFVVVVIILGIPLGYTKVIKSENEDGKTAYTIKSGNYSDED